MTICGQRQIDLHVGMEINANDGDALVGLGFDMLDAADVGGERALEIGDDAALPSPREPGPLYCQTTLTMGMSM